MITTIVFDLAEVYLKGLVGVENHLEPILKIRAEEIYPKIRIKELDRLFLGKLTEEEYWLKVIERNNWGVDVETLKKAIRDNFEEIKGVRDVIEELKDKGFKLGLLSIHAKEWIDYCNKKFDYHKLFNSILYSFEVGSLKPQKRSYELILRKLNSKPEESIFIDNEPENLATAKKLGMKTIHFKNSCQLKAELRDMGVL
jgi:putative hydrolase of the HAD superfamily